MTTKVGRLSVTQTIPTKGKANQIINNAIKREQIRKLPTWFERVFGYNTPQSEEIRKQLVKQSEKLGKLKTQEILKQIDENKELRKITNKIKETKSKEGARRLLKKWSEIVKTKKQLRTRNTTRTQWKKTAKARTASATLKKKMNIALSGFGKNTARSTVTGYGRSSRRTKKTLRKN